MSNKEILIKAKNDILAEQSVKIAKAIADNNANVIVPFNKEADELKASAIAELKAKYNASVNELTQAYQKNVSETEANVATKKLNKAESEKARITNAITAEDIAIINQLDMTIANIKE